MKTIIYVFAFAIFLFAGCAKDEMFEEPANSLQLKRANVPTPLKVDLCAVPDMESSFILKPIPGLDPTDPNNYITSRMIISGNGTRLGKVNPEKSYYDVVVFELLMENNVPFLYQSGTGLLVGANGDSFSYNWWAKASLPTLDYVGGIELTEGTGKFEGCSGSGDMVGRFDEVNLINCWTSEGFIKFDSN
jgi:hypothetical protein